MQPRTHHPWLSLLYSFTYNHAIILPVHVTDDAVGFRCSVVSDLLKYYISYFIYQIEYTNYNIIKYLII